MSATSLPPAHRVCRGLLLLVLVVLFVLFACGVLRLVPGAWPWLLARAQQVRDTWTAMGWHLW
ncbi:hypothetical protein ORV05_23200 [Amycolatopsis cynarae]|uniref:Uncharacterized protein n=1 Tax=Amycolatopsis cynarae TaxID=2995223 RepID=A0ABY7AV83_9PSEU|nr:hypothetical protein [Amycolatopsis sp. HUAS 11-8]WAL63889.1 hypothetical protein ORV05_23200 [Amycolatopsis sp. HUAS 11-8]